MIDKANGNITNFTASAYADARLVDTIAVNAVLDALILPAGTGHTFIAFTRGNAYGKLSLDKTAADGLGSWTSVPFTLPSGVTLHDICYHTGSGEYAAVGMNAANNWSLFSSPDGALWTEVRELPRDGAWDAICYGNGMFVAVNYNPARPVGPLYSTDGGLTWAWTEMPIRAGWIDVCYGNGTFVALRYGEGAAGYTTNHAAYSTNGKDWAIAILPYTGIWRGLAYGNGRFVAIEYNGETAYSTDGLHWTRGGRLSFSGGQWYSVSYGDGTFVALSPRKVTGSPNGRDWSPHHFHPGDFDFGDGPLSSCYGGY